MNHSVFVFVSQHTIIFCLFVKIICFVCSLFSKSAYSKIHCVIMGAFLSSGKSTEMAMKFVTEAIAKDKVVIFSKTHCPYCRMAKEVKKSS